MRPGIRPLVLLVGIAAVVFAGCEKKTTRKVEVNGPDNKYEVKVEKTEKK